MKALFNLAYYLFVLTILSIGVLLLATLLPLPGSIEVKVVQSGSMEPTIKTGGIVVIRSVDTYKLGDIITFGPDTKTQIPTTHRIVGVEGLGPTEKFVTKGDANDDADPTLTARSAINGKVIFSLPYLGYLLDFARKPLGFGLLVGIPALMIICDEIGKIVREIKTIRHRNLRIHVTTPKKYTDEETRS